MQLENLHQDRWQDSSAIGAIELLHVTWDFRATLLTLLTATHNVLRVSLRRVFTILRDRRPP